MVVAKWKEKTKINRKRGQERPIFDTMLKYWKK